MEHDRDTYIESMLDTLGEHERARPDIDFESRIATNALEVRQRTPGRRRLRLAPLAVTGMATAAAVMFALLPSSPTITVPMQDSGDTSIAEMSFTMFDDTFGLDAAFADSGGDAVTIDPASFDDWLIEGDSL